jgi:YggT family protein
MLTHAVIFLLDTIVGFLSGLLLLRFYMQAFRVSFGNPLGAFVVQLTNWLVKPLRRILPGLWGLDLASLLPAYLLQVLLLMVVYLLRRGGDGLPMESLFGVFWWLGLVATLRLSLYVLMGALILQAVLSWVNPYSPLAQPVSQLTGPFLKPLQRAIPPIAGIDLLPLIAIVLAQVVLIFLQ